MALRFSLFPGDDREQGVRFRRFLIAAGTSLLVLVLLGVCVLANVLAPRPFGVAAGIVLVSVAAFYAVFRSGLNRHARDPSLTVPMMLAAIGVVTYALYHLGAARTVFLLVYPMVMFFGVFRLATRALLLVGTFILCAYALVVWLLRSSTGRLDPQGRSSCCAAWSWPPCWCGSRSWAGTSTSCAGGCTKAATID